MKNKLIFVIWNHIQLDKKEDFAMRMRHYALKRHQMHYNASEISFNMYLRPLITKIWYYYYWFIGRFIGGF